MQMFGLTHSHSWTTAQRDTWVECVGVCMSMCYFSFLQVCMQMKVCAHSSIFVYMQVHVCVHACVPTCCLSVSTCSCRVAMRPSHWPNFSRLSLSRFWLACSSSVNWSRASSELSHWPTFSWYRLSSSASSTLSSQVAVWESLIYWWNSKNNNRRDVKTGLIWSLHLAPVKVQQIKIEKLFLCKRESWIMFKYCICKQILVL